MSTYASVEICASSFRIEGWRTVSDGMRNKQQGSGMRVYPWQKRDWMVTCVPIYTVASEHSHTNLTTSLDSDPPEFYLVRGHFSSVELPENAWIIIWKGSGRKRPWPELGTIRAFVCMEESHEKGAQDSNLGRPEYELRPLPLLDPLKRGDKL
jgi:hypothetical protein